VTVWKKLTVQDLVVAGEAEVKTGPFGTQLHASDYVDEGIPVINVRNIGFGEIKAQDIEYISEVTAQRLSSHLLQNEDIVFGRKGAVERHAFINKAHVRWFQGSDCLRLRINSPRVIPRFISYRLLCEDHKQWMMNQCSHGATMASLNQDIVKRIPLNLPPIFTQHKIAAVLSAYDDLIENNLRRIKILEEMAQTIYREWFVNFLFPGHQKIKMVNSPLGMIPEGWEVVTLDDILATLESGSRPKGGIDPEARGVPSIGAENIIGLGRYDYSKEKFVTREFFDNMNRGHVQSGDVLLYKDGAQIGRKSMFRDGFPHVECCINEHAFILRTNGRCSQNYLFFWFDQPGMTQNIINLNSNAAQPGINQSGVRGLSILLAPASLLENAEQVLEPMLRMLFNHAKRNNVLRRTRDLLLPKLISGELDVSELDIAISEANA
jgi:type I restriction enzyme, S subunit